jgi:hypothetical protein
MKSHIYLKAEMRKDALSGNIRLDLESSGD